MCNASMLIFNARRNRLRGCSEERKIFSPFTLVKEEGRGDCVCIRKILCTVEEKLIATREKEKKERMRWRKKRRRTKRKKKREEAERR